MSTPRTVLSAVVCALCLALAGIPAQALPRADTRTQDREALRRALKDVVERTALSRARVSLLVESLSDGQVVFSQNPEELLNPASNVKLFTAAVGLARLGPEYRFETEFLTDADLDVTGKAKILYVRGKGDPSVTTERLFGIVSELSHAGVKEISDLVLDESWFDAERLAPGYDQEDSDRSYMAPTGALSLNWNAVGIYLRSGAFAGAKASVEMEPPSDYFVVDASGLSTGTRQVRRFSVSSRAQGEQQKIVARGVVPLERSGLSVWKKIDHPAMYFGQTFKRLLVQAGIKVKGKVKLGATPPSARLLYVAQSDSFDIILKRLNKLSSNFVAEQIIKTLGAEVKGAPGSFAKGIEVVEEFLESEVGLVRGSYVMKNGSGLNDTNRFSAQQIVRLLRVMNARFPLAAEYLSSVGIAGKDGTIRLRFEGSDAVGRLRAKTGTLENVSALSGYVQAVGGELFAFSLVANDFLGRAGPIVQGLDALGSALASSGSQEGLDRAVASLVAPEAQVGTSEELKTRVKTYLSLAKQQDRRNISFLRTAWRTEKDPAVRAVVADAIHRSGREDYLGVRALLDSFAVNDLVYGRLRTVSRDLGEETPCVSAVLDLAASGNAEALSRSVELGRYAVTEDGSAELPRGLVEISRTAADELIVALKAAAEPDRVATLSLLAKGLARAGESQHPLWAALKKAIGSPDGAVAGFARSLEAALSVKIAEEKAPSVSAVGIEPAARPVPTTAEARPGG